MDNAFLKHLISRQADCVLETLSLQELVDLRVHEGGIGLEVKAHLKRLVSRHHESKNIMPTIGGVDVAGSKRTAFQIAELIEDEQRVMAGAAEVTIVGRTFLLAIGWADAGIHIQHDGLGWAAAVNTGREHGLTVCRPDR